MEKNWWKGKVAYQIYPKSFNDSNNDGYGDLKGITEKLDYLQDLGIDILWLSPMFQSPFVDQGYDISDYYKVDPIFGTDEDMDELIAEAKKRGIAIVLDLVVNHCSDQHEWFQQALADPDSEYRDYFYFVDSPDGPPSNWRSYFGGNMWEQIPGTDTYYFHSFHKAQPDLNWQNPVVRRKIYDMMNWWMDKGVAGFRIDAIINIKKDLNWTTYESEDEDGLVSPDVFLDNAQPIEPFLREMYEETFKKYNAFAVGEVFNESDDDLQFLIGGDESVFSSIFDFKQSGINMEKGWHHFETPTAEQIKESIFAAHKRNDPVGVISTIIENHDQPRGVSRFILEADLNDTSKKALATIFTLRKGIPFIYQGQEIGMENQVFTDVSEFDDISTLNEYKVAMEDGLTPEEAFKAVSKISRDNARTPVQWDDSEYLGFSTTEPWLYSKQPNRNITVAAQLKDENSVLHFYRRLTRLYKHDTYGKTIQHGDLLPILAGETGVIAYERVLDKRVAVIVNFQAREAVLNLEQSIEEVLLNNYIDVAVEAKQITLKPYQALVLAYDVE
ncbi:glycoside hydrolase family 13 protein [Streptococcus cameli]